MGKRSVLLALVATLMSTACGEEHEQSEPGVVRWTVTRVSSAPRTAIGPPEGSFKEKVTFRGKPQRVCSDILGFDRRCKETHPSVEVPGSDAAGFELVAPDSGFVAGRNTLEGTYDYGTRTFVLRDVWLEATHASTLFVCGHAEADVLGNDPTSGAQIVVAHVSFEVAGYHVGKHPEPPPACSVTP